MRLKTLRRRTLRQARRELLRDSMSLDQYKQVVKVCDDNTTLAILNIRVEREVNPWNYPSDLYGADWRTIFKNIWDWFVENWPAILRIILTIAPLLILEDGDED